MWVPGVCLLDGMAAEYGEETRLVKFKHDFSGDIIASARVMAKRYKSHIPHIQALEEYALGIFDAMKKYHGMGKRRDCCFRSRSISIPAANLSASGMPASAPTILS